MNSSGVSGVSIGRGTASHGDGVSSVSFARTNQQQSAILDLLTAVRRRWRVRRGRHSLEALAHHSPYLLERPLRLLRVALRVQVELPHAAEDLVEQAGV